MNLRNTLGTATAAFGLTLILVLGVDAQEPAAISGTVVDESGGAVVGATMTLLDAQGKVSASQRTDTGGNFAISVLIPGKYTLQVEQRSFQPSRVPLDITGNSLAPIKIVMHVAGISQILTVTGELDYTPPVAAAGASKTETPLLELPRALQMINGPVLEDRQVITAYQAVENVSGVSQTSPFYDTFLIRGFSNGANSYRNFLKTYTLFGVEDFAFVERVEIAKGPSSEMFGRVAPGGVVNYVTKQPWEQWSFSVQQQIGSWGQKRTVLDATGPINRSGTLLYRSIFTFDRADSYIDYQHHRNFAGFGDLSWRPTPHFSANLQVEGYNQTLSGTGSYAQQIPAIGSAPANLPRNWSANDPAQWNLFPETSERAFYTGDWSWKISERWKLTQRFLYLRQHELQRYIIDNAFNPSTGIMTRFLNDNPFDKSSISGNLDLVGDFTTGPLHHTLLFGGDVYHWKQDNYGFGGITNPRLVPDLNIYSPASALMTQPVIDKLQSTFAAARANVLFRGNQKDFGPYLQDQIRLTDRFSLLLGLRYDYARDESSRVYGNATSVCFPTCNGALFRQPLERQVSPTVGLSARIFKDVRLFSSFSKSFAGSNTAITFGGVVPAPQKGRQYEVGAKASLLNGRIFTTATLFLLYQYNLTEADPAHPGYSNVIGEVRSRGGEFDLTGRISRHLSLVSNYTYDAATISAANGTSRVVGRRLPMVPRHLANVWARWDTAPNSSRAWIFGLGTYLSGNRFGESTNVVLLPAYGRLDAMAGYRSENHGVRWSAQLNAGNVGDKIYFLYGNPFTYGAPRSVILSLKAQFAARK